jgi:hypothetical protein
MLRVASQIVKVETTSDGAIKLAVVTQELHPTDKAELMNLHNKLGWFVFAPTNKIRGKDITDEPRELGDQKITFRTIMERAFPLA